MANTKKANLSEAARKLAGDVASISADGWSFRDSSGRLLLDRDGTFDAAAEVPGD